jgi:hypothetical protein
MYVSVPWEHLCKVQEPDSSFKRHNKHATWMALMLEEFVVLEKPSRG